MSVIEGKADLPVSIWTSDLTHNGHIGSDQHLRSVVRQFSLAAAPQVLGFMHCTGAFLRRQMERREFITLVGCAAASLPLAARAQQARKVYRIGFLSYLGCGASLDPNGAFRRGLREVGY